MGRTPLLFLNVLIIATCGLVYELVAGTLASYVLGDSVTQFSICIGVYLSALGVGAWLSGYISRGAERAFVEVELGVALLGGLSAPLLFLSFARLDHFQLVLYGTVFGIGTLVGLELPLLMRILKNRMDFKDLVSRVLTFDYIGALVGSLMFPLFLVPRLGLVRTSLAFGLLNALVGLWGTWLLADGISPAKVIGLRIRGFVVLLLLTAGLIKAGSLTRLAEEDLFPDNVVFAKTTHYQRIVVTQSHHDFSLFLNGNLQFSSTDEHRYHEALVHPAAMLAAQPRTALVLGGGDGLGTRELLKHDSIEQVTLVDLDPEMTDLGSKFAPLVELNHGALLDDRVEIVNQDAMIWLQENERLFDLVIIDFPDPNNFALGKLYTRRFYRLLANHMAPDAVAAVQCTSPFHARKSYWCVINTMRAAGLHVHGYHCPVPSFRGPWGYALAMRSEFEPPTRAPADLRFLNDNLLSAMFVFPNDMAHLDTEVNRLDNQMLVRYYDQEWRRWVE
ncbi:MAG: polyamine aminopropyltransferase [Planctomycetales bacterium]|nr:polyamine aminopropyltransferase [Planctomycetales bacterium]